MGSKLAEARASMDQLMGKARSQLEAMEAELAKVPFPEHSLMMKLRNAMTDHDEVGNLYERILVLNDLKKTEDESLAFQEFKFQYHTTINRVQVALATHRKKEDQVF